MAKGECPAHDRVEREVIATCFDDGSFTATVPCLCLLGAQPLLYPCTGCESIFSTLHEQITSVCLRSSYF
jgi:hypothetical protein